MFKVAAISYPNGSGAFIAGELSTHEQVEHLFSNFSWTSETLNVQQAEIVKFWTNPNTGEVFSVFVFYLLYTVSLLLSCEFFMRMRIIDEVHF